jgi:hypothetical protein
MVIATASVKPLDGPKSTNKPDLLAQKAPNFNFSGGNLIFLFWVLHHWREILGRNSRRKEEGQSADLEPCPLAFVAG